METENLGTVEHCRSCGLAIDISALAPMSLVECPGCFAKTTVIRRLGAFSLEKLLGQGGMGMVFQATDLALRRHVAIKVLHRSWSSDPKVIKQFESEASVTARVNHPHVVRVFSTGKSQGMFYIAMELVEEGSLDSWMHDVGCVPEADVLEVGIQVAEGLLSAYRAGLIHRDIKPGNILFGSNHWAKIVDFGLAMHSLHHLSNEGEVWGTPDYISPEALMGQKEDFHSDMFALGATLWHALVGTPPFPSESHSIEELVELRRTPVHLLRALPSVHPLTAAAINHCLAFDPAQRYAHYEDLIQAFKKALEALETHGSIPRRRVRRNRHNFKPLVYAASVAAVAAAAVFSLKKPAKPARAPLLPISELSVSDTARLKDANQLLASGRLEEATELLELIRGSPNLPPKLAAWGQLSLVAAYTLQDKIQQRAPLMQALSMVDIPGDPAFSNFIKGLPGIAPGTKWRGDTTPEREAFRQLWIGIFQPPSGQTKNVAKTALEAALRYKLPETAEIEATAPLPLAKLLLQDFEMLARIESKAMELAEKNPPEANAQTFSEMAAIPLLSAAARNAASEILARAKATKPKPAAPALKEEQPAKDEAAEALNRQRIEFLLKETAEFVTALRFDAAIQRATDFIKDYPELASKGNARLQQVRTCALLFDWCNRYIQSRPGPLPYVILKNGSSFPGRPVKSDNQTVTVETEVGGTATLEWKELSPEFLISLINHRLSSPGTPALMGDLFWMAGNFHLVVGSPDKGWTTLKKAADLKPAYQDVLRTVYAP